LRVAIATARDDIARLEQERGAHYAGMIIEPASEVRFEVRGVDVGVSWDFGVDSDPKSARFWRYGQFSHNPHYAPQVLSVELKPEFGDDFPSVMRQMKRLGATVLVAYEYNGRGASEAQMRAMFKASGIQVVFVHEIEAEVERAKHVPV